VRRVVAVVVAAVLLTGCTGGAGEDSGGVAPAADSGTAQPAGTLTVFAAASLTDVFPALGDRLEEEHPGLEVRFSFAGSSALAQQILQGAPADVFASADEGQMARVADAGLVENPEVFARNPLMLVVPRDNPAGIERPGTSGGGGPRLAELLTEDVTMAVCAPEVPCGAAAAELLGETGLSDVPDTFEEDVRAVLTKVELGEVDAGLVYLSDVHAAGDSVLAYAFREAPQAINRYPVGVLAGAPNAGAARAFVDLVLSDEGDRVLREAGFLEP
jgi:molybdate transport system substrate-binding protein